MRILIVNVYSAGNRGDAGIVLSAIEQIRQISGGADIALMSSHHRENEKFYSKYNVRSVPSVWHSGGKRRLRRYFDGIWLLFLSIFLPTASRFSEYSRADLIFSIGGGYLYSSPRGPLGLGLLSALFHIWLGTRLQKRVICLPQSVGPLRYRMDRMVARSVLKRVHRFYSREPITTDLLRQMGLRVSEVADLAFGLNVPTSSPILRRSLAEGAPRVGITVIDWGLMQNVSEAAKVRYIENIATAIEVLSRQFTELRCYIFPQVTVEGASDEQSSAALARRLGSRAFLVDLSLLGSVEETLSAYGEMDLVIGTRMHSTIFAMAMGVPAVAIAYQPKTTGTFQRMNISENCLEISSFNGEQLAYAASKILQQRSGERARIVRVVGRERAGIREMMGDALGGPS